jgi:putative flippase GtrA
VRFLLYSLVGGTCLVLNFGVLWLLTSVAGLHYLVSTMISFLTLTPVGFVLQKVVTFRTPGQRARVEWPRYFVTMGLTFAANLALMYVLVSLLGVWSLAASLVVAIVLLAASYAANARWSFATAAGRRRKSY